MPVLHPIVASVRASGGSRCLPWPDHAGHAGRAALLGLSLFALIPGSMPTAAAQDALPALPESRSYTIAAGPLSRTLTQFASEAGIEVSVDAGMTDGMTSPGVSGSHTVQSGFAALLAGTGLEALERGNGEFTLRKAPVQASVLPAVKVTAEVEALPGELPKPYVGGQVARGARVGVFGNQDILSTPFSITSFTEEFRENIQANSISDVLKYAVSAQTPQLSYTTQNDIVFLRGFLTVSGFGSFDGLSGLLNRQPPIEPLERIELLLGPTAFANGRVANVGGTINVVPKRAPDAPLTNVGVRLISDSYLGSSIDVARRFGKDDAFGVRVNAAYSDGEVSVEDAEQRATTASLAADYRGERLRWALDYIYNERDQTPFGTQGVRLAPGVQVPKAPDSGRLFIPDQGGLNLYARKFSLVATRASWTFDAQWEMSGGYGRSNDKDLVNDGVTGYTVQNDQGDFSTTTYTSTAADNDFESAELLVRGSFAILGISHRLTVGATRLRSEGRSAFDNITIPLFSSNLYEPVREFSAEIPRRVLPPNITSRSKTSGLFVSDELAFVGDRLLLTLGLRNTALDTDSFNGATGARTGGFDDETVTPAVGLLGKPLSWLSVYANYVEALEAGAIAPSTADNAGQEFPPLASEQIEIGAKADFGRFATTLALFQIERGSQFPDPRTNLFAQDGRQDNQGAELTLFGEPLDGLRLYTGISVIDASLKKTSGGTFDGNDAPDVPEYSLTASVDWDVWKLPGWSLLGGLVRTGAQEYDNANTATVPAWTRLDAGIRYNTRIAGQAAVFRFNVENLADKNYFMGDRGGLNLAAPRTLLMSAVIDF